MVENEINRRYWELDMLYQKVKKYCPFLLYPPGEDPNQQNSFITSNSYLFNSKNDKELGINIAEIGMKGKMNLMNNCGENMGNGLWLQEKKKEFLEKIRKDTFSIKWCSYIISITGLSYRCYGSLSEMFGNKLENGKLVPSNIDGVIIGNILPSMYRVKKKCKDIFYQSIVGKDLKTIEGWDVNNNTPLLGYEISLKAYLELIFSTPKLKQIIGRYGCDVLEILVNADALPVADGSCWIVSYSLGNLGKMSHTLPGRVIGNIATIKDSNYENVKLFWNTNLEYIENLSREGKDYFKDAGGFIKIKIVVGADDAFMRIMKGLNSNSSRFFCSSCYDQKRDWAEFQQNHIHRSYSSAKEIFEINNPEVTGQIKPPLFNNVSFSSFIPCSLHTLLSFRRNIMFFIFNYNMNIELNNRSVEIRNKINFYLYHICGINL